MERVLRQISISKPQLKLLGVFSLCAVISGGILPSFRACGEETPAKKLREAKVELFAQSPAYADAPVSCNGTIYFSGNGYWKVQSDGPVKAFDLSLTGAAVRDNQDLLVCGSGLKGLLNLSADGKIHPLANEFESQPLNSLNDVTIDSQGRIYWTDPVGSSRDNPTGKVFRLTPDGKVSLILEHLAFPTGIEVDPGGTSLIVMESQTCRVLKYSIPAGEEPFGAPRVLYDVGGTGGDGCAFDGSGNLWFADFHRRETGQGRVTVISPEGELIGSVGIPAKVVSNVAFGGEKFDELYCTTAEPPAVFRIHAGVVGFAGHRAPQVVFLKEIDLKTLLIEHPQRPRKVSRMERKRRRWKHPEPKPGLSTWLKFNLWKGSWSQFESSGVK